MFGINQYMFKAKEKRKTGKASLQKQKATRREYALRIILSSILLMLQIQFQLIKRGNISSTLMIASISRSVKTRIEGLCLKRKLLKIPL